MKIKYLAVGLFLFGISLTAVHTYYFLQGYLSIQHVKMDSPSPSKLKVEKTETPFEEPKPLYDSRPAVGQTIGELYIPRLEQLFPILEGTGKEVLRNGVGHYIRSALPGEDNNTILSGHRDTVFRGLRHVKENDELIVTTMAGQFTYKIYNIRIVEADDTTVMTPKPRATLTVTTCYPFYFVGNAPKRYVISAKLISKNDVITLESS